MMKNPTNMIVDIGERTPLLPRQHFTDNNHDDNDYPPRDNREQLEETVGTTSTSNNRDPYYRRQSQQQRRGRSKTRVPSPNNNNLRHLNEIDDYIYETKGKVNNSKRNIYYSKNHNNNKSTNNKRGKRNFYFYYNTVLGWFRRIGRGLQYCIKIMYSDCMDCMNNSRNMINYHISNTFSYAHRTAKANTIDRCIEINPSNVNNNMRQSQHPNNQGDRIESTSSLLSDDYYYENEFIDDDDNDDDNDNNHQNRNNKNLLSLLTSYCTYGTDETSNIWFNYNDQVGTIMSCSVWILIMYSSWTMVLLGQNHHMSYSIVALYNTICILALSCHIKTTLTNPGAVTKNALPCTIYNQNNNNNNDQQQQEQQHTLCSSCQSYKPLYTHHCRICNRCIIRMDHHCPWMNNCIGILNLKFFILFLLYVWIGCCIALLSFGYNYFLCIDITCEFNSIEIQLVRIMTILCIGTILFVSSMILNVMYGIVTGIGTIDRMQKKVYQTWNIADEEPIPLHDIFGIDNIFPWWFIPTDPIFNNYEHIMGYTTPKRYQRACSQLILSQQQNSSHHQHQQPLKKMIDISNIDKYNEMELQRQQQQVSPPQKSFLYTPDNNNHKTTIDNNEYMTRNDNVGVVRDGLLLRKSSLSTQNLSLNNSISTIMSNTFLDDSYNNDDGIIINKKQNDDNDIEEEHNYGISDDNDDDSESESLFIMPTNSSHQHHLYPQQQQQYSTRAGIALSSPSSIISPTSQAEI